jgi:DNA polymerase III subunit delta'
VSATRNSPPWFAAPCSEVEQALGAGRLTHGLLIHEDLGAGGLELARWVAQRVNCAQSEGARSSEAEERASAPCGECQQCRWIGVDQHPDVTLLKPEGESVQILIQPVRDLAADLALTSHGRGYKVAIIAPADAMNPFAANALLKTLEEPPRRTLVLLVTSQPSRLLPTLRSRCSRLRVRGPTRREAAAFLAAARGAGPWEEALCATGAGPFALLDADPAALAQLRAETLSTLHDIGSGNLQPPAVAERWARGDLATRLACLESWVTESILESSAIRDATHLSGAALPSNICRLFEFSDAIRDMRKLAHTSINKTMAVETLLWRWARA